MRDELLQRHALPAIETAVRFRLRSLAADDASSMAERFNDICNDALLQLMVHLENCRKADDSSAISNFGGYSYTVALNVYHKYRFKYFRGAGLAKLRVRAAISRSENIESWRSNGIEYCGLTKQARRVSTIDEAKLQTLVKDEIGRLAYLSLDEFILVLLTKVGHGIEVQELTRISQQVLPGQRSILELDMDIVEKELVAPPIAERHVEQKQLSEILWKEIKELSPKQRIALLYYESDGRGNSLVESLFNAGIAKLGDIAAALDLDHQECAVMISRLPLDTSEIAERLGIEAGSVYDIRQSAQRTLTRRMSGRPRRFRKV